MHIFIIFLVALRIDVKGLLLTLLDKSYSLFSLVNAIPFLVFFNTFLYHFTVTVLSSLTFSCIISLLLSFYLFVHFLCFCVTWFLVWKFYTYS